MKVLQISMLMACVFLGACTKSAENVQMATENQQQQENTQGLAQNEQTFIAAGSPTFQEVDDSYFDDDYFDDDYIEVPTSDPLRPWNNFWFKVNDFTYLKVLKPVHLGYQKVVPEKMRSGFSNFRHNLKTPIRMTNAILQADFSQFFTEFGKLMINVMTSAGFADVASSRETRYPSTPENLRLGYTLAKWGVPQGPYIVLPFLGPSTLRETVGTIGDSFASPQRYLLPWEVNLGVSAHLEFNNAGSVIKGYEVLIDNSLEPYVSLRNAYLERLKHTRP